MFSTFPWFRLLVLAVSVWANCATCLIRSAEFIAVRDMSQLSAETQLFAVSADGLVAVGYSDSNGGRQAGGSKALLWTKAGGTRILNHSNQLPEVASWISSISGDGLTAVYMQLLGQPEADPSTWRYQTSLWSDSQGFVPFGETQPNQPSNECISISAISFDGSVLAGSGCDNTAPNGPAFPAIWTVDGSVRVAGPIPWANQEVADAPSGARDVSADGRVIVGHDGLGVIGGFRSSFYWTEETGYLEIKNPFNDYGTYARAVSSDGNVVVGGTSNLGHGFVWSKATGLTNIDYDFATSLSRSHILYETNGDGSIAVGQTFSTRDPGDPGPFVLRIVATVWDRYHGNRSIQELLLNSGLTDDLAGWQLERAFDVSDDGLTIVGQGIDPDGQESAWWARLDPEPAPNLLPGDANLDGAVDETDFFRLRNNFGQGSFWYQGNFDGNGRVDLNDFAILRANLVPEGDLRFGLFCIALMLRLAPCLQSRH